MFVNIFATYCLLLFAEEAISYGFNTRAPNSSGRDRYAASLQQHSTSKRYSKHSSLRMKSRDDSMELTKTSIDAPTLNSRKITASIIVNSPIDDVWSIITDYNNLATHVPNLVKSYVIPPDGTSTSTASFQGPIISTSAAPRSNQNKNVRIFQEGAQKIVGFDFRASLTMDMREEEENEGRALKEKKLTFKLAESSMFSSFDGTWSIRYHSRVKEFDASLNDYVFRHRTLLTYSVLVKPKGPVPVIALEWRIKEDVPINLMAMKTASEKVTTAQRLKEVVIPAKVQRITTQWGADETLGMYIRNTNANLPTLATEWDSTSVLTAEQPYYPTSNDDATVVSKRLNSVLNSISAAKQSSLPR